MKLDNDEMQLPCGECGHEVTQTIAWIKSHDKLICPVCGAETALDREKFLADIENVEKLLDDFEF